MENTIEIDDEKKIIIARLKGLLNSEEGNSITGEVREQAKALGYKILLDLREAQYRASTTDVFLWMRERLEVMPREYIAIPTAHLISEKDKQFFRFVETAWHNLGANVKLFVNEDDAWAWLESI